MGKTNSRRIIRQPWHRRAPFDTAEIADLEWTFRESNGRLGMPPEASFHAVAGLCANGWSWFPQERAGQRRPIQDENGNTLTWRALQERRPDEIPLPSEYGHVWNGDRWVRAEWDAPGIGRDGAPADAPTLADYYLNAMPGETNAAIVLGDASGRTFAVDIDVSCDELAPRVREVVEDVLGKTPLVRHASGPRVLMVYRYPEGEASSYRRQSWSLEGGRVWARGKFQDAAVEILWANSPFTAAGRHHYDHACWRWENGHPGLHRGVTPDLAPEVTVQDVEDLHQALKYRIGLKKEPRRVPVASTAPVRSGGHVVPAKNGIDGVVVSDGKIIDGRKLWAFHRSRHWVVANWNASEHEVVEWMTAEAQELFADFRPTQARDLVRQKVRVRIRERNEGRLHPMRLVQTPDGSFAPTPVAQVARDTGDAEIEALLSRRRTSKLKYPQTGADERIAAERALIADRASVRAKVARDMRQALEDWYTGLYTGRETVMHDGHVFKAPTGAGKTSMAVQIQMEMRQARGSLGAPVVLMVPTYRNAAEIMDRVESLREISPDFKAMVFEGKARLCAFADTMKTLQKAGIGTSNMCKWRGDEGEEQRCKLYESCPAILQQLEVPQSDLVILVQQFLTCQLPKCLKEPRALIVDESHWQHLLATASFPLSSLLLPRREPYVTKKEAKDGTTRETLIWDRDRAVEVAVAALERREDPALALHEFRQQATETLTVDGLTVVRGAIKLCQRASDHHKTIRPGITLGAAKALADNAKDKDLLLELRFWRLCEERLEALKSDELQRGLHDAAAANDPHYLGTFVPKAKSERDARIQTLGAEANRVRLSWRPNNNFAGVPLLMLDASAESEIVAKTWDHRKVVTTEIDAPLHLRVLAAIDNARSTSSLVPGAAREPGPAYKAAKGLNAVRQVAAKMGMLFGHRSWGFCAPKAVNESLVHSWPAPPTMVPVHFGALRGLDHLKSASAMLLVGRNEPSIETLDGLVAALTYDDLEPEQPVDRHGTGLNDEGKPVLAGGRYDTPHVIRMRDGSDVNIDVPQHVSPWARLVQRQIREEEILQGVGRLRPVYREGEAPLVVMLTSVVPDALVVDEVCHIDDLTTDGRGCLAAHEGKGLSMWAAFLTNGHGPNVHMMVRGMAQRALEGRMGEGFVHVEHERDGAVPIVTMISPDVPDPVAFAERIERVGEDQRTIQLHHVTPGTGRIVHDPRPGMPAVVETSEREAARREYDALLRQIADRQFKSGGRYSTDVRYLKQGLLPGFGPFAGAWEEMDVWRILISQTAWMPETREEAAAWHDYWETRAAREAAEKAAKFAKVA